MLKKFLPACALFVMTFAVQPLKAQLPIPEGSTRYYLTLQCVERPVGAKGSGATVNIPETVAAKGMLTNEEVQRLNRVRYPSLAEALNRLSPYGWTLQTAYSSTVSGQTVTTWVLGKDVTKDAQLGEGLTISE